MKLKALKSVIDKAVKSSGKLDPNVEVYFRGAGPFTVMRVGQLSVVPDVIIDIDVQENKT